MVFKFFYKQKQFNPFPARTICKLIFKLISNQIQRKFVKAAPLALLLLGLYIYALLTPVLLRLFIYALLTLYIKRYIFSHL